MLYKIQEYKGEGGGGDDKWNIQIWMCGQIYTSAFHIALTVEKLVFVFPRTSCAMKKVQDRSKFQSWGSQPLDHDIRPPLGLWMGGAGSCLHQETFFPGVFKMSKRSLYYHLSYELCWVTIRTIPREMDSKLSYLSWGTLNTMLLCVSVCWLHFSFKDKLQVPQRQCSS